MTHRPRPTPEPRGEVTMYDLPPTPGQPIHPLPTTPTWPKW